MPTASAVLGDLLDAAHNLRSGGAGRSPVLHNATIRRMEDLMCEYYLNIEVADRPGVLAAVAGVFGEHNVSIRSMEQEGIGDEARLYFLTHVAREGSVRDTLAELARLDAVGHIGAAIRIVGDSG